MDEVTTAAPDVGATSGGDSGASSAPVSTPVSTPAPAASTPAPSATPTATPSTEPQTVAPPERNPGESEADLIKRYREMREKAEATAPAAAAKPEPQRVDAKSEPTSEAPKEEPKAAEAPKDGEKPAEVKAEEPNPLDKEGSLSVEKFAETLKTNPELEAALTKAGVDRGVLEQSLRDAAETQAFKQVFTDLEDAKYAADQARSYVKMDMAAQNLARGDFKSTGEFIRDVLYPMDYVFNEKGEPVMNADGSPQVHGAVDAFLDNVVDLAFDNAPSNPQMFSKLLSVTMSAIARDAAALDKKGDEASRDAAENLRAVSTILQGHFKSGPQSAGEKPEIPAEVQQEIDRLKARDREVSERETKAEKAEFEGFRTSVTEESNKAIDGLIDGILNKTNLSDFTKEHVKKDVRNALFERWADPLFRAKQEQLIDRAGGFNATARAALLAHYNRRAQADLQSIVSPILKKAGGEAVQKAKDRADKIATQTQQSRMEPKGGTAPAIQRPTNVDPKQVFQQVKDEMVKATGQIPDTAELLAKYRERMGQLGLGAA